MPSVATGALLLWGLSRADAFIAPLALNPTSGYAGVNDIARTLPLEKSVPQWRSRNSGRVSMANDTPEGRGESSAAGTRSVRSLKNDSSSSTKGPLRRVRSLFGRKAAAAAAVSAALSASNAGPAAALGWGKGKTPEVPSAPAIEQQLEEIGETAEGMLEEGVEQLSEKAEDVGAAISDAVEDLEGVVEEEKGELLSARGVDEEDDATAGFGAVREQKKSQVVSAFESLKEVVAARPKVAAVAIAGAAGAVVVVTQSGGSGKSGRRRGGSGRNSAASRSAAYAPESEYAGIGQPRVSPEITAARAKAREDSLKGVNFDVDLDLFGDAGIEMPSRPPPPTPPAPEPPLTPSQASGAIQGAMAAREDREVADASLSDPPASTVPTALEPASETAQSPDPEPDAVGTDDNATAAIQTAVQAAAESAPVRESEAPVASPKKQEKKRRGPMLNIFNKDKGPQRATSLEAALSGDTSDEAVFRQGAAAVLARSAPPGAFDVEEPRVLEEAGIEPVDFEGEAGKKLAESTRVNALTQLAEFAQLSQTQTAEAVADVVNAMVVRLVDSVIDGVGSKDDASTASAVDALLTYMDGAGGLFAALCPGVELNPPIRYNGSARKGKLEKVFEAAARNTLKLGDEGQMGKLDRLQDMFNIKEGKANSITQKIMMDLMMKMMSEGGAGDDAEGFEKMMKAMGGGMPGMGANRSPEEHKKEVEALRAMVDSGEVPTEEVEALRKMYTDAGMDLDQLVTDPAMEAAMDSDAKEVVGLLRKLLASAPK